MTKAELFLLLNAAWHRDRPPEIKPSPPSAEPPVRRG